MAARSRSLAKWILIVSPLLVAKATAAGPPAVPDYEVKFFLDPAKTLDNLNEPSRVVHGAFDLSSSVTKLRMLFLDSRKHDLNEVAWNVRLRTIEGESGIELAYKKRFRIGDRPLSQILEQAASDGFGADDPNYRAQVEWGSRRTLSFTRKKTAHVRGVKGMELPEEADARRAAVEQIAGKLDRTQQAGWARGILAEAHVYGPVKGRRWSGKLDGLKLDLEVWEVRMAGGKGTEPIVELSFKEDDGAKAESHRAKLERFLKEKGWLLKEDVLKTELILQRY
jgi:hypothetical protein